MMTTKDFDALIESVREAASRPICMLSFDRDAVEDLITEARAMREALTWKPIEEADKGWNSAGSELGEG